MLHNLVVSKIIVNIVRDYLYRDMPLLQSLIQLYREKPITPKMAVVCTCLLLTVKQVLNLILGQSHQTFSVILIIFYCCFYTYSFYISVTSESAVQTLCPFI